MQRKQQVLSCWELSAAQSSAAWSVQFLTESSGFCFVKVGVCFWDLWMAHLHPSWMQRRVVSPTPLLPGDNCRTCCKILPYLVYHVEGLESSRSISKLDADVRESRQHPSIFIQGGRHKAGAGSSARQMLQ